MPDIIKFVSIGIWGNFFITAGWGLIYKQKICTTDIYLQGLKMFWTGPKLFWNGQIFDGLNKTFWNLGQNEKLCMPNPSASSKQFWPCFLTAHYLFWKWVNRKILNIQNSRVISQYVVIVNCHVSFQPKETGTQKFGPDSQS